MLEGVLSINCTAKCRSGENGQDLALSQTAVLNIHLLIIIMDICKAPTLRLKALKKHSITHIMYIEMEILSAIKKLKIKNEKLAHNVDKGFSSIKNTASVII